MHARPTANKRRVFGNEGVWEFGSRHENTGLTVSFSGPRMGVEADGAVHTDAFVSVLGLIVVGVKGVNGEEGEGEERGRRGERG